MAKTFQVIRHVASVAGLAPLVAVRLRPARRYCGSLSPFAPRFPNRRRIFQGEPAKG